MIAEDFELTVEQERAIKSLERAFKKCKDAGIKFCGMDYSIIYATAKDAARIGSINQYGPVASAYQAGYGWTVNDHKTYTDSGGW